MAVVTNIASSTLRFEATALKVSKQKAAANRELILNQAARLFRERGASGVGVDALTQAAGLTHGSLYSQFGSKDCLLAEALRHGHACATAKAPALKSVTEVVPMYLSVAHRDNPGAGCFMAALGCDMPRQSGEVRHSFTEIVRGNIARIAALLPGRRKREEKAMAILATMVGAMVLARAVDDPQLSGLILASGRAHLLGET